MPDLAFDSTPLIRAAWALNRVFALGYQRLEVATPCPLPADGPAILICNHVSGLDPFLLQATCPRVIRWMMAKEYFDLEPTRGLCERLGYISVARKGRDSSSLKAGLRALAAGQVLGIFPEGKINDTPDLLPFQPGVALLATRARVPVYPARLSMQHYHSMWYPALDPQWPRLTFGAPFAPDGELESVTARMHAAVSALGAPRAHPPVTRGNWF